ncbi:MAG TPA: D-Ala-D-Ala carboxypeptidase family metallohydrolase [Gammaproteobacteria bacterium]|nr:D-Ala-D-Ala carboxypeptidase family metallohydrolase [Gammaproteobacteria bacterium]
MWEYFSQEELQCRCGCRQMHMKNSFMVKILSLRKLLQFPFKVTSAYRCPSYNQYVSTSGLQGPHTTGRAIDIAVYGEKAFQLVTSAGICGLSGIGIKQSGSFSKRFIHLDDLQLEDNFPRPNVWNY